MGDPTEAAYEAVAGRTVFYAIIAPRWRAPFRPTPGLGSRPLLRWQVVRGTRWRADGPVYSFGYEHHSAHWTLRAAQRAATRATWRDDDG